MCGSARAVRRSPPKVRKLTAILLLWASTAFAAGPQVPWQGSMIIQDVRITSNTVGSFPVTVVGGPVAVTGSFSVSSAAVYNVAGSSLAVYTVAGSSVVIRCTDLSGAVIGCGSSSSAFAYISASIPVAGGAGFATFSSTGSIHQCSTSVPASAIYDFEIDSDDADQFPVFGRARIPGRAALIGTRYLLGAYKMLISSASVDGTYKILCVVKL